MIKILDSHRHLWRNMLLPFPAVTVELDLGELYGWTAARLSAPVTKIIQEKLPGLRMTPEMDAAQFIAEIAQQFQLIGDVTKAACGVHARDAEKRTATIFFACMDKYLGSATLNIGMKLLQFLAKQEPTTQQLSALLDEAEFMAEGMGLDQSTRKMIAEAEKRDIPWFRINRYTRHIQLGQGMHQRRIRETLRSAESPLGIELARFKLSTLGILAHIALPVGKFAAVNNAAEALRAAAKVGYPLVLKPDWGKKGTNVHAGIRNEAELKAALATLPLKNTRFLVQSFFPGDDHRILVVNGKMIAAARRTAPFVTGDGKRSVRQLVEIANRDPRRGEGYTKLMNFIVLDNDAIRVLAQHGHTLESIPKKDEVVRIKSTANISAGGTAVDVTDIIHPDNARAAVRAAKALELTVAGVDFISPDISKSWREVGGGICEVNSVVGLRPHVLANPQANIVAPIIDTIFPAGQNGRIPTAMITGTKGKSTTAFMLGGILTNAGHNVGTVTTDGVTIGDEQVETGDFAGYTGASLVLRDATVTAAVLETARGGLLTTGMYLDWCDVAVLTNVGRDQIGMGGIETVEEMAALKRRVLDAAKKAVVLNADDAHCAAMAPEFSKSIRTILFSLKAEPAIVRAHLKSGGEAIILKGTAITLKHRARSTTIVNSKEIPATMNGLIQANIANAMAAAGLAIGLDVPPEHIRNGLMHYDNSAEKAGGRFSFVNGLPMKVLFDRAAQAPAFAMALPVTDAIPIKGKRICAFTVAGNRPLWSFEEAAAAISGHFDHYICFEVEHYRRGKKPGEIGEILSNELQKSGVEPARISLAQSDIEAARLAVAKATKDDLVVMFGFDANSIEKCRGVFHEAGR